MKGVAMGGLGGEENSRCHGGVMEAGLIPSGCVGEAEK